MIQHSRAAGEARVKGRGDETNMRNPTLALLLLGTLLSPGEGFSQTPWREAPEKWSLPLKIGELSAGKLSSANQPTLTADSKTMYYFHFIEDSIPAGIYRTVWQDTGWGQPNFLNLKVNSYLSEGPSISPDGKRLYFRSFGRPESYGGWDLYYSDWDPLTQEWGPAVNLGPNINSNADDWGCFTPDSTHLYWNRYGGGPYISAWSDSLHLWTSPNWEDSFKFLGTDGRAAVPASRRKIYYDVFTGSENNLDIFVHYYDSLAPHYWTDAMYLNLNRMLDSLVDSSMYGYRRIEGYPWISPDGHTLYFMSTHDSTRDIWMSKLLIDENGNPVVSVDGATHQIPREFELLQNYPNPFNPSTTIRYGLPHKSAVQLAVYNTLGQQVATLVQGEQEAGFHEVRFDGSRLSSGVYLYRLQAGDYVAIKKLILLK
jgi:hypothetical protein